MKHLTITDWEVSNKLAVLLSASVATSCNGHHEKKRECQDMPSAQLYLHAASVHLVIQNAWTPPQWLQSCWCDWTLQVDIYIAKWQVQYNAQLWPGEVLDWNLWSVSLPFFAFIRWDILNVCLAYMYFHFILTSVYMITTKHEWFDLIIESTLHRCFRPTPSTTTLLFYNRVARGYKDICYLCNSV